jgi:hypothetical protein
MTTEGNNPTRRTLLGAAIAASALAVTAPAAALRAASADTSFAEALAEYARATTAERAHPYPSTNRDHDGYMVLWDARWSAYERVLNTRAPNIAGIGEKIKTAKDIIAYDNEADAKTLLDAIATDVARLIAS